MGEPFAEPAVKGQCGNYHELSHPRLPGYTREGFGQEVSSSTLPRVLVEALILEALKPDA